MKLKIICLLLLPFLPRNTSAQHQFSPANVLEYKVTRQTNSNGRMIRSGVAIHTNTYEMGRSSVPFVPTDDVGSVLLDTNKIHFPFQIMVVETSETKEIDNMEKQAKSLLEAKEYDKLDDLAAKYRLSKESYANGYWKLNYIYSGLCLPDSASDAQWGARISDLRNWILAKPDSITARVALAENLVLYAWKARGDGYADTVSGEGWRLFNQRLKQAMIVLEQAKNLGEKCPRYWYVLMWTAAGLQFDGSQLKTIFKHAIIFEPQFDGYYFRRAFYLLPRWYGDKGDMEKDLNRSADLIGGDNGDVLYAKVVWYLDRIGSTNVFKEYQLAWERVDKGFASIEKRFPNSLAAKSERAHLAVLASEYGKGRTYFDQTQGKVDLSIWNSKSRYEYFAALAYTLSPASQ